MIKKSLATLAVVMGIAFAILGQTTTPQQTPTDQGITLNGVIGEVQAIDTNAMQMTVKTDAGSIVTVALSDKTIYLRLAPGEKTLTNATKITVADVGTGDRIWARGKVADDRKSVPAAAIVVMSKADIAKKQEAERAEWRRRGLLGIITAIKPESKEITISSRSMAGTQSITIPVTEKVDLRRYAPDSIKFSDAKPSTFEELKVGDQLRALGDRSADGTSFTAERIVTGAFKTVAGTVSAIDATTGEVKIRDLQTKQVLTIVIKQDAVLRKFPAEFGGMAFGRGPGAGAQGQAPAARPQQPNAQGGGGPRPGGFNIQDMLERLPTVTLADLKNGDTIIVSSTQGADPSRLTAITVISGADTLLAMLAPRPAGGQAPNPAAGLGGGNFSFGIGLP